MFVYSFSLIPFLSGRSSWWEVPFQLAPVHLLQLCPLLPLLATANLLLTLWALPMEGRIDFLAVDMNLL